MKTTHIFSRFLSAFAMFIVVTSLHANWIKTTGPDSVRALIYGGLRIEEGGSSAALFAGSKSGVFRSLDGGINWNAVNGGLTSKSVRALAIFRDTLFAGTEGGGIFRSANGGTTWTAINTGLTNMNVFDILIMGTVFYVGTEGGGVFRSTNRGANWNVYGIGSTSAAVNALESNAGVLYAGTGEGVFTPANIGENWSAVNAGLTNLAVLSLVWNASFLYSGMADGVYVLRGGSPNPGWKKESFGSTNSPPIRALASTPAVADIFVYLIAGTQGAGVFFLNPSGWSAINEGLTELDVRAVGIWEPYMFAGTDGGVWRRPLSEVRVSSVEKISTTLQSRFTYGPNNAVSFSLPSKSFVSLEAFGLSGKTASIIFAEELPAGTHTRQLNTTTLPNGLYFYRFQSGTFTSTRKVLLSR